MGTDFSLERNILPQYWLNPRNKVHSWNFLSLGSLVLQSFCCRSLPLVFSYLQNLPLLGYDFGQMTSFDSTHGHYLACGMSLIPDLTKQIKILIYYHIHLSGFGSTGLSQAIKQGLSQFAVLINTGILAETHRNKQEREVT